MELLDKLEWRYATKAMNGQKIPQEKIDNIIEAISLAPTSSGLQPFEVYVITNQEVKDKIKPIAWNQSVVSDCSHLLVFAAWDTYTEERINKMFDLVNEVRGFKNVITQLNKHTLHFHKQSWQLHLKKLTLLQWKVLMGMP
jgi:nitroreductase/dihydropteridine reductase